MYLSVLDTPFLQDIATEHRKLAESMFVERQYPKGQVIFFQGDEGNEMYIVKSGALKIYRQDENREIILGHQFPGEPVGELEAFHYDNRRAASAASIEKTVLWMIKKQDILELAKLCPEMMRKTIYVLGERLAQANRKLEYLAFLDTRVRVGNLLLDLYSNFGVETEDGLRIEWKITQQHFADMIGLGRESVARVLQELQNNGLVRIVNKQIHILDLAAIQSLSGAQSGNMEGRKWHSTHKYDSLSV